MSSKARRTIMVSAPLLGSERCCLHLMPLRVQVAKMRGMSSAGGKEEG